MIRDLGSPETGCGGRLRSAKPTRAVAGCVFSGSCCQGQPLPVLLSHCQGGGRLKLRPVSCLPAHAEVWGTRKPQKWLQAPRPRLLYPTATAKLWLSLPSPVDPTVSEALGGLRNPYTFLPQVSLRELGCLAAARGLDTWGWRPASVLVWPPTCLSGVEES